MGRRQLWRPGLPLANALPRRAHCSPTGQRASARPPASKSAPATGGRAEKDHQDREGELRAMQVGLVGVAGTETTPGAETKTPRRGAATGAGLRARWGVNLSGRPESVDAGGVAGERPRARRGGHSEIRSPKAPISTAIGTTGAADVRGEANVEGAQPARGTNFRPILSPGHPCRSEITNAPLRN